MEKSGLILVADAIMYVNEKLSADKTKAMVYAQAVTHGKLFKLMGYADGKKGDKQAAPLLLEQLKNLEKGTTLEKPAKLAVSALDGNTLWVKAVFTK